MQSFQELIYFLDGLNWTETKVSWQFRIDYSVKTASIKIDSSVPNLCPNFNLKSLPGEDFDSLCKRVLNEISANIAKRRKINVSNNSLYS